jgi:hypothetical protein
LRAVGRPAPATARQQTGCDNPVWRASSTVFHPRCCIAVASEVLRIRMYKLDYMQARQSLRRERDTSHLVNCQDPVWVIYEVCEGVKCLACVAANSDDCFAHPARIADCCLRPVWGETGICGGRFHRKWYGGVSNRNSRAKNCDLWRPKTVETRPPQHSTGQRLVETGPAPFRGCGHALRRLVQFAGCHRSRTDARLK